MAEEHGANGGGAEPSVQVRDRRRFTPEGDPIPSADGDGSCGGEATARGAPQPPAAPGEGPAADPRDGVIAQQAARIDELTRAYAALVEEGKAARARLEREKARVLEADRAQLAQALLEGVDHLDRALAAARDATGPLVDGVRLTLSAMERKVTELGASRIPVMGQRFDPRVAEAVDVVPVDEPAQDDVVVEEIQSGYRIGDRVLRPARVRVGRLARA